MNVKAKKYDVIYADPPWQYKVWKKKGGGCAESHYQTQSPEFLKEMNIQALCEPDCILFMWATFPCLEQALELGKIWGFTYKTVAFTWVKTNKNNGKVFVGMGYYTRANAEVVLLFTKGKSLRRDANNVPQVLISQRGRHSEKPDEIRKRIVRLYKEAVRVELFVRNGVSVHNRNIFDGWDVFGNEVDNSISIPL